MVQHPVARVLQKFINLHRTQLQSYLFIYLFYFIFNLNRTTCFVGPSSGHPQVWFLQAQYTEKNTDISACACKNHTWGWPEDGPNHVVWLRLKIK
jgi:hypothetical protein